jgi:hypothetical protein
VRKHSVKHKAHQSYTASRQCASVNSAGAGYPREGCKTYQRTEGCQDNNPEHDPPGYQERNRTTTLPPLRRRTRPIMGLLFT